MPQSHTAYQHTGPEEQTLNADCQMTLEGT